MAILQAHLVSLTAQPGELIIVCTGLYDEELGRMGPFIGAVLPTRRNKMNYLSNHESK